MANSKIPNVTLQDTFNTQRTRFNQLLDSVGDVATLTTTATDVTSAINEHDAELGTISSAAMGTTASTVSTAIAELDDRLDSINTTQIQSAKLYMNDSSAVNYVKGKLNVHGNLYTGGGLQVDDSAELRSGLSLTGKAAIGGDISAGGSVHITNELHVNDSAYITGNLVVGGNTTLGGAATDTVTVTADVSSNLIPSADNTYDLGATGSEWRHVYADGTVNADELAADSATIGTLKVSDLNEHRIVLAGHNGELREEADFTFDGNVFLVGSGVTETRINTTSKTGITTPNVLADSATVTNNLEVGGNTTFLNTITVQDSAYVTGELTVSDYAVVDGVRTPKTTFNLVDSTANTINFGGHATTINIGEEAGGTTYIHQNLTVDSSLTVTTDATIGVNNTPGTSTVYHALTVDSDLTVNGDTILNGTVTSTGTAFTIAAEYGTDDSITLGDTITFAAGEGIETTVANNQITIAGEDATASNKGVAKFASADFSVSSGNVTIKSGGVSNTQLAGSIANSKLSNSTISIQDSNYGDPTGTAQAVDLGDTIKFAGSQDQINFTVTADQVYAALNNDVNIDRDLTVGRNFTVTGNFTIQGKQKLAASFIQLNDGVTGAPTKDAGITVDRGTADSAVFKWDESLTSWVAGTDNGEDSNFNKLALQNDSNYFTDVEIGDDLTVHDRLYVSQIMADNGTTIEFLDHLDIGNYDIQEVSNIYVKNKIYHHNDVNTYLDFTNDNIKLWTGATARVEINNNEIVLSENLKVNDSAYVTGNLQVGGDTVLEGNLTVKGTTTSYNSNTIELGDNIIELNNDVTGNPLQNDGSNAGLEVNRGSYTNTQFLWNETAKHWVAASDSDNTLNRVVTSDFLNTTDALTYNASTGQIGHATSAVTNTEDNNSGNTFVQSASFSFDSYGHVTGASLTSGTATDNDTTYTLTAAQTGGTNANPDLSLNAGGSGSGSDTVTLTGSGATSVTRTGDGGITISSTDTNTTYSAATNGGLSLDGTAFSIDSSKAQSHYGIPLLNGDPSTGTFWYDGLNSVSNSTGVSKMIVGNSSYDYDDNGLPILELRQYGYSSGVGGPSGLQTERTGLHQLNFTYKQQNTASGGDDTAVDVTMADMTTDVEHTATSKVQRGALTLASYTTTSTNGGTNETAKLTLGSGITYEDAYLRADGEVWLGAAAGSAGIRLFDSGTFSTIEPFGNSDLQLKGQDMTLMGTGDAFGNSLKMHNWYNINARIDRDFTLKVGQDGGGTLGRDDANSYFEVQSGDADCQYLRIIPGGASGGLEDRSVRILADGGNGYDGLFIVNKDTNGPIYLEPGFNSHIRIKENSDQYYMELDPGYNGGGDNQEIRATGHLTLKPGSAENLIFDMNSSTGDVRVSNNGAAVFRLYGNYNPSDNQNVGGIYYTAQNSADQDVTFSTIVGVATDVTDGTEDAKIEFRNYVQGTLSIGMTLDGKDLSVEGDVISLSDRTVKENIETVENGLDLVTQLRGVWYNMIGEEDRKVGVIAQEVEEVLPEVVTTNSDGIKGVDYGKMVGVLIEAVKDLKAEVEELKAKQCNCGE